MVAPNLTHPDLRRLLTEVKHALSASASDAERSDFLLPDGGNARLLCIGSGRHAQWVVVIQVPEALPDVPRLRTRFGLTRREAEVTLLLAQGYSNKQIAQALGVKTACAARHGEKARAKLGVSSRRHVRGAIIDGI